MAKTKSVSVQMEKILADYSKSVALETDEVFEKVSNECVQKLKDTSPKRAKRGGKYARSWTVKRERKRGDIDTFTVHNAKHYQLTHLLENGHVIRNAKGEYGRTRPIPHIAPVEEWAISETPIEIKRKLE